MASWGAYLVGAASTTTITHPDHFKRVPRGALAPCVAQQVATATALAMCAEASDDEDMTADSNGVAAAAPAHRVRTPTTVVPGPDAPAALRVSEDVCPIVGGVALSAAPLSAFARPAPVKRKTRVWADAVNVGARTPVAVPRVPTVARRAPKQRRIGNSVRS